MPLLKDKHIYFALSGLVFIYLLIKSIISPLIFEEATTYLMYVQRHEVLPWQGYWSENNQFLNTVLVWFSYLLFGIQEWNIRLPNLIVLPIFFFYLFKIGGLIQSKYLKWGFWITILGAHFLMEFFGLSRGIGLSLAFLMAFIWNFIKFNKHKGFNSGFTGLVWLALATAANLNLYFLFTAFAFYVTFILARKKNLKAFITGGISLYLIPFFSVLILMLKDRNQLFTDEENNLYQTVDSLTDRLFLFSGNWSSVYLIVLFVALLIYSFYAFFILKNKNNALSLLFLLGVNLLALLVNHVFFQISYPTERMALHLFVLFVVILFFVLDQLPKKQYVWIILAPLILIPLRFFADVSIYSSSKESWSQEQIPQSFYNQITSNERDNPVISGPWIYNDTWVFNNLKSNDHQLVLQDRESVWEKADYIILPKEDLELIPAGFSELERNKAENLFLYKSKQQKVLSSIFQEENNAVSSSQRQFIGLMNYSIKAPLSFVKINAHLKLQQEQNPFLASVVVQIKDKDENSLYWRETRLNYLAEIDKPLKIYDFSLGLDKIPEQATDLLIFIYNVHREEISILNSSINLEAIR